MHGGRESTADSLYDVLFTSSAYSFGVNQSFSVGAGSYRFAHLLAAARLRKKANDPVMMTYYYQEVLRSAPPSGLTHDVIEEALSSIIDYLNTISDENVSIDMDVLSDFNAIVDIASIRNGTVNINENLTFRYACAVYRVMYLSGISTYRYDRFNPYESFSDLKEWYASLKQKGQAERRAMDYLLYTDAIAKAEYPLAAEYLETLKPNGMNEEDVSQEQNVYMLTLKSLYSSLAKDHTNAMKFIREAERVANEVSSTINDKLIKVHIDRAYGEYYLQRNVLDSALIYLSLAVEGYSTMYSPRRYDLGSAQLSYTAALSLSGRTSEALYAYQDARLRGISMAHMTFAMIRPYVTALVKALSDNEKYYDAVALYEDELRILQEEHSESSPLLIEPLETMISLFPLKYQTKIFDNDNDEYSNYYQYDNYWLYSKCRAYRQWLTQLRGR
jgi:hypothetical protein